MLPSGSRASIPLRRCVWDQRRPSRRSDEEKRSRNASRGRLDEEAAFLASCGLRQAAHSDED